MSVNSFLGISALKSLLIILCTAGLISLKYELYLPLLVLCFHIYFLIILIIDKNDCFLLILVTLIIFSIDNDLLEGIDNNGLFFVC